MLSVALGTVGVFVTIDLVFQVREQFSARRSAYDAPNGDRNHDRRIEDAIRYRIAMLTRPPETKAAIGRDPSSRYIEAGLLYGRLALLLESQGRTRESESSMAMGVSLLRQAGHPEPTEAHIRLAISRQDSAAAQGPRP